MTQNLLRTWSLQKLDNPKWASKPRYLKTRYNPAAEAYVLLPDNETILMLVVSPPRFHADCEPGAKREQWVVTTKELWEGRAKFHLSEQEIAKWLATDPNWRKQDALQEKEDQAQ